MCSLQAKTHGKAEFEEVQDKVQTLCPATSHIQCLPSHTTIKKKDELIISDDTKTTVQENMPNGMLNFDEEEDL